MATMSVQPVIVQCHVMVKEVYAPNKLVASTKTTDLQVGIQCNNPPNAG